ncbi:MAG: hypothetical protein DCC71_07795 [Proteobacteria bacterium]|nr:MAG: hypothetical protein DCC71_07795 [Pseudomonadota bacterium]
MRRRRTALPGSEEASPFAHAAHDYAHNLVVGTHLRTLDVRTLRRVGPCEVLLVLAGTGAALAGRDPAALDEDDLGAVRAALRAYLRETGRAPRPPRACGAPVADNLARLAAILGLDADQRALLQLLVVLHAAPELKELANGFGDQTLAGAAALAAAAIGATQARVLRALAPDARLLGSGLVSVDESDTFPLAHKLELKRGVLDLLLVPALDERSLAARFVPELEAQPLAWADFAHVGAAADTAKRLLAAALASGAAGVNVLLHGPTGTGKTALAALLGRELGVPVYAASREREDGDVARGRLGSLLLGQRLVPRGRGLLVFDELEDLFASAFQILVRGGSLDGISKQAFNRHLETNPVPTIWITNSLAGLDPAFVRRFRFAMELAPLGARQRARVLARHLGAAHRLAAGDIDAIAERFSASPAQLGSAVATARMLAADGVPDRGAVERVLAPIEKLLTGSDPLRRTVFDAARYDVAAVACSVDLAALADRLADWKPSAAPGLSLCLHGPPGTGKTEFVRWLAHRMDRPLVAKRASDLLSPFVGETEQRIAAAFEEAERDDAVLLFDEADGFLRDRRRAQHAWEASQVNEFLQQLESFRGVVACTTNLADALDAASLRRFVFKIEFGWLAPAQAWTLLGRCLAELGGAARPSLREEPRVRRALDEAGPLAPGDFAAALRRLRAVGAQPGPDAFVRELAAETHARVRGPGRIGF